MTIYETLGIDHNLRCDEIPKDAIIYNLPSDDLQDEAHLVFNSVDSFVLRASINRSDHCLQVIEVNLSLPQYIERISYVVQKAIRHRVLFVFVYEQRYLLLWRNFNITESTENVYTYHTTRCTNWIYSEYLIEDFLAPYDLVTIDRMDDDYYFISDHYLHKTDDDNGEGLYFADLLNNVIKLNQCVLETDYVSARFIIDWLQTHSAGYHIGISDIVDEARDHGTFLFIEESLFFEKNRLINFIWKSDELRFTPSIGHTGKNPMVYLESLAEVSTFEDESDLIFQIAYSGESIYEISSYKTIEHPNYHGGFVVEHYGGHPSYLDEGFRRYNLRHYHVLENESLTGALIRKLRRKGCQTLENVTDYTYNSLSTLTVAEKVELMLCMSKYKFRLKDCPEDKYPKVRNFILEMVRCKDCNAELPAYDWKTDIQYCPSCHRRHIHLAFERAINCNISNFYLRQNAYFKNISFSLYLSTSSLSDHLININSVDIYNDQNEVIASQQPSELNTTLRLSWDHSEMLEFRCSIDLSQNHNNRLGYIGIVATRDMGSEIQYLFEIITDKSSFRPSYQAKLYDYIDEHGFAEEAKRKAEEEARLAEERRKAEEEARLAEERRKAEEEARLAEEKRKAEEARLAEERRKAEEARLAEERRKAEEARLAEERRKAEEARLAEEKRKAEEARLAEERRRAAEEARLAEERRKAEEARLAEERRRAEEEARLAEERRKAEDARLAEERRRAEEEARLAEEKRKEQILEAGLFVYNKCSDIIELSKAKVSVQSIGDWKRAPQLVQMIQAKISDIMAEKQRAEFRRQKVCQHCGGTFKGLFSKRCGVCGKPKDY